MSADGGAAAWCLRAYRMSTVLLGETLCGSYGGAVSSAFIVAYKERMSFIDAVVVVVAGIFAVVSFMSSGPNRVLFGAYNAALSLAFAGQGALLLHCADNWQSTKWWRLNALVGILVLVIVSANTALLVEYWDVMAPTVAVAVLQVILNAWLVFVSVVQLLAALKVSCAASLEGEPLLQAPAAGASVS